MKRHHPNYPVAPIKKGRSTLEAEQTALVFFHRVMEVHDRHQLDCDLNTIPSQTTAHRGQIMIASRSQTSDQHLFQELNQPPPVGHRHQRKPQSEAQYEPTTSPSLHLEPNPSPTPAVQGDEDETEQCEANDIILQEIQPPHKKRKRDENRISPVPAPVYLITNRKLRHYKGAPNLKKCYEFLLSHSLPICCSECSERGTKRKFPRS